MSQNELASVGQGEGRLANSRSTEGSSRFLIACGYFLIAFGGVHIAIWLLSGEPWSGAVSWRKPVLFGISGGLTLLSLGYLSPLLTSRRADAWTERVLGAAMCIEVGLISLQQWRGVESHFNRSTALNGTIDTLITVFITVATLCIIQIAYRAFTSWDAEEDQKVAWYGGLVFLLISCLIGFVIFAYGFEAREKFFEVNSTNQTDRFATVDF